MLLELLVLILLIALSAFFSGAEIALISLSNIKVRKLVKARRRGAKTISRLKQNPQRMLSTILVCNNVVNVAAATLATLLATQYFDSLGIGIVAGAMTLVIIVFGEIVPKTYFHQNAERMSLLVAQPMYIITIIMYPVTALTGAISRGILRLGGVRAHKDEVTEEEILAALSLGTEAGAIDRDEEAMMQNVIEFGESMVKEAMVPLRKVVCIKDSCNLMDVITLMLETKFSRLPVCHGRPDNIVGVLNLRGILKYIKKERFDVRVSDVMEPIVSVSEYLMLDEAFEKMKERSAHIAVVKDIQRHVIGIITMEDLLEEIVGEIYDESDRKRVRVKFMDRKTAIVNGETLVTELQKKIGVPLKSRYPTISDLVSARMDGRPKAGRCIKMKNFILTVLAVDREDPSKIKRIRIVKRRGKIRR